jgi:hypothetical protein
MKTVMAKKGPGLAVTDDVRDRAIAQGLERAQWEPHATSIRYLPDRHAVELAFNDSTAIILPIAKYPELVELAIEELKRLTLSFGGSVLCLKERDLYVSIAGLVSASGPLMEVAAAVVARNDAMRISGKAGNQDGLQDRGQQDRSRINMDEPWEVAYWTRELGVTEDELKKAVKNAGGDVPAAVRLLNLKR